MTVLISFRDTLLVHSLRSVKRLVKRYHKITLECCCEIFFVIVGVTCPFLSLRVSVNPWKGSSVSIIHCGCPKSGSRHIEVSDTIKMIQVTSSVIIVVIIVLPYEKTTNRTVLGPYHLRMDLSLDVSGTVFLSKCVLH